MGTAHRFMARNPPSPPASERSYGRWFAPTTSTASETWATLSRGIDQTVGVFLLVLGVERGGASRDRALIVAENTTAPSRESRLIPSVRLPGALLLDKASKKLGREVSSLSIHPLVDTTREPGESFGQLIELAADVKRRLEDHEPSRGLLSGLENAVADALLDLQPFRATHSAERQRQRQRQRDRGDSIDGPRIIRRVESLIQRRLDEDLTIRDLAAHAGVSARTLFRNYRRFRGRTPLQALREARLARVREDLLAGRNGDSVTQAATRSGFTHLGRFSEVYRACYGENPSETLRRSRSEIPIRAHS